MTLFDRVSELSKKQGLSIFDLSNKLGLSRNAVYSWKTSSPKADTLDKVADYFNVSTDYLLGRTNNDSTLDNLLNNEEAEMISVYKSLPKNLRENINRYIYNVQTDYLKSKNANKEALKTEDMIEKLEDFDDLVIQSLIMKAEWMIEYTGGPTGEINRLLENTLLLIDLDKTGTGEFINLKKVTIEILLPLNYFILANEHGVDTVLGIANRYHFTVPFVLLAIEHYISLNGASFEKNGYKIDFNEISILDEEKSAESKVIITPPKKAIPKNKKRGLFSRNKQA